MSAAALLANTTSAAVDEDLDEEFEDDDAHYWTYDAERFRLGRIADERAELEQFDPGLCPVALHSKPLPPPRRLCREIDLCVGRPLVIVGPSNEGKSFVAKEIVRAARCQDRVLFGRFAFAPFEYEPGYTPNTKAAWLDYDGLGASLVLDRLRRMWMACGEGEVEGVRVVSAPSLFLNSKGFEDALKKLVSGCCVCVLDSLRSALPKEDENNSGLKQYLDLLSRVSTWADCAFVVIVHATTKKETSGISAPRGTSAIADGAGAMLSVDRRGAKLTLTLTKATTIRLPDPPLCFELEIADVEVDGDPLGGLEVVRPEQPGSAPGSTTPQPAETAAGPEVVRLVEAAIRAQPGIGRARLRELVKKRQAVVDAAVATLVAAGRITDSAVQNGKRLDHSYAPVGEVVRPFRTIPKRNTTDPSAPFRTIPRPFPEGSTPLPPDPSHVPPLLGGTGAVGSTPPSGRVQANGSTGGHHA